MLSALDLLQSWERGLSLAPIDRALALLATACSDSGEGDPSEYSLGERDARLLTLRELTFGSEVVALAACPGCRNVLELQFRIADIRVPDTTAIARPLVVTDGDYEVKFRLPSSNDLRALRAAENGNGDGDMVGQLVCCCVLEARFQNQKIEPERLPGAVVDALSERMGQADPQAEVELAVECSDCQHKWTERFDIESFFWAEIQAWAARMLREVHQLAAAYGWSESEILGISPLRRSLYLNLIAE